MSARLSVLKLTCITGDLHKISGVVGECRDGRDVGRYGSSIDIGG